jgi:outer membrane protein TolC
MKSFSSRIFLDLLAAAGLLAGVAVGAQPLSGPLPVTLDEALARARTGNALLQAARADVQAKEGQFKEARSYFVPDLAFTEGYSRTNNPVYVFMGKLTQANFGMNDFYIPSLNNPEPLTNFQSRVEITAPLFTGGKLKAAYKATKLGVEAAESTAVFAESSVVKGVTEAFYGSLLARQAVGVMGEAVKTAQAHLKQVEAMHAQGLILDSDLLRMRVFAADMEQQEASRRADAQVAVSYLAYAMGTDEDVEPVGDFVPPADALPSLEEAQRQALERRGDLRALTLQAGQAQQGIKMAKADYMPQVGLMAAYEQDTQRWSPGAWGDNWMLGVQLKLSLFDGGARAGRLMSARAQETQVQQALLDRQQKIRVEVKSAWLRAQAAAERVAVTTDSEAQAKENQRIVALRYNEGLASITELLDADTALTAASLTRSQAIHDELVERAHLDWATGK